MKKFIIIFILSGVVSFCSCAPTDIKNDTEYKVELEAEDKNETENDTDMSEKIKANQRFLVDNLNVGETGALGTAQVLADVGCGLIKEIKDVDDDGKSYEMSLIDNAEQLFYITMGYDGYLGTVKNVDGDYLYTPVE